MLLSYPVVDMKGVGDELYAFFRLRSKILVASDICAARCGHVRIMMYDVIPNVPTSWTCYNLMNKVNKVQKVKITQ
jgi:hypothetical protein